MQNKKELDKNISLKHNFLVKALKKKINFYNSKLFMPDLDMPIYFNSSYNYVGLFIIKKIFKIKIKFLDRAKFILKDFFYILKYINITSLSKSNKSIEAKKIILTWGDDSNISKNGSFNDRYLNVNSRSDKSVYWIIIFSGSKKPKTLDQNIMLIYENNKLSFNFFNLIKIFFLNFKYLLKNFDYFLFSISSHNFFSKKLLNIISKKININVKSFLLIYESQPFQNRLIKYLKSKNIKTTGYIHFPPLPLPVHLIKKKYSPDKIILNGNDQKKCFLKLGWKKKEIILKPSSRFIKKNNILNKKIFLPISIKSSDIIIKKLKVLVFSYGFNLKNFIIKNHPFTQNSKIHLDLISRIKDLQKKSAASEIIYKKNNNFSIFIGTSGAIIEELEKGCKVIQITEYPIIDCYSSYFWESIQINQIDDNIFSYTLKKKQNMIKFGIKTKQIKYLF